MKNSLKKSICLISVAATVCAALIGCSSAPTESLVDPLPWRDGAAGEAYEKLCYTASVYDTTIDKYMRKNIASGTLTFTLEEGVRGSGPTGYTRLDADMTVTYNSSAAEIDRGLTDSVKSVCEFQTNSLAASSVKKEVKLEKRTGKDDLSYVLEADYFDKHTATLAMSGETQTVDIPEKMLHDNEMMYLLARSAAFDTGSGANFFMVNLFDSIRSGETERLTMVANAASEFENVNVGKWFTEYIVPNGVREDETYVPNGEAVPCYKVAVYMNKTESGPPHYIYFTRDKVIKNGKTHSRLPVKITYSEYDGMDKTRETEYTLDSFEFEKAEPTE